MMRSCLGGGVGGCGFLTLCEQLGDRFTVVLGVITLLCGKLLIGRLHALFKRTVRKTHKIVSSEKEHENFKKVPSLVP